MPRQSRKKGYGKRRMRGGGWLDSIKAHANNAVAQAQDLANHPKAQAAQQAAIDGASKAHDMIASAHTTISASGQAAYAAAKPHLDTAQMHAQAAATHATNANFDGFKQSMGSMTDSLAEAHSESQDAVLAQKTSGDMTVGDHVSSLGSKATSTVSDLSKSALGFFSSFGSKSSDTPAPVQAAGRRTRKHRRHPKGQKSLTMKGRKDFTTKKGNKYYNRRGHRQSKNANGVRGRPYRTRKGGNPKKGQKSLTMKGRKDFTTKKGHKYYNRS
jgi:hypothetical protein